MGSTSSSAAGQDSARSSGSESSGLGLNDNVVDLSVRLHDDSLPTEKRRSFQTLRKRRRRTVTSVVSGLRKQRSVLHGTGTSKWWQSRNWYYLLLDMRFLRLMGWILLTYVVICLLWSLLSWPLFEEIFCDLPDDNAITQNAFGTAFVFATSNVLTMGSGMCYAQGYLAAVVGFLQNFIGIIINVAVFSIFVVKLQQPRPEVIFSKQALITTRDGEPIFMFRIGNKRVNLLYNPAVYVSLLEPYQTSEGETFVRYRHLNVDFPNSMTGVATAIHTIDHDSPLLELTAEDLENKAINVVFTAHDGVYNDLLSCTTQYKGRDIVVGDFLFRDMMESVEGSKFRANFKLFHELKAADKLGQRNVLIPSKKAVNAKSLARQMVKRDPSAFPMEPKDGNVYLCFGCLSRNGRLIRVCGYSRVIGMVCVEAGIPFEIIDIDWRNKPAWFLASTHGRTPVIYLNGVFTYNTRDIITTLEEAFPSKIANIMLPHKLPLKTFELYSIFENVTWGEVVGPKSNGSTPEETNAPVYPESQDMDENQHAHPSPSFTEDGPCQFIWTGGSPVEAAKSSHEGQLFICVGARMRGESLVKACVTSQQLEATLLSARIRHWLVLVDIHNLPAWITSLAPAATSSSASLPLPVLIFNKDCFVGSFTSQVSVLMERFPGQIQQAFPEAEASLAAVQPRIDLLCERAEEVLLHRSVEERAQRVAKLEAQVLEPLEALVMGVKTRGGGDTESFEEEACRVPFMEGHTCGLQDIALAPFLSYYAYLLNGITSYVVSEKFPRIARYLCLVRQMGIFRCTLMPQPETHFVREFLSRLKPSTFQGSLPPQCTWNALRKAQLAEDALVDEMKTESALAVEVVNTEGSIDVSGGAGPVLEPNTLYLAAGCGMRGYQKVRVCPFSRCVEMALLEADIPYKLLMINLADKPTWFTRDTNGFCPNLYWNGQWTPNSQDILNLLRKIFPESMQQISVPSPLPFPQTEMALFEKTYELCATFLKARRSDSKRQEKLENLEDFLDEVERALQENNPGFDISKEGKSKDKEEERDIIGDGGEHELTLSGGVFSINDITLATPLWTVVYVTMGKMLNYNLRENFPFVNAYLEQLWQRRSFKTATVDDPVPFILYWTAKMYGQPPDSPEADDSFIILTSEIYQAEKDAVSKAFLQHNTSMRGKNAWTMDKLYQAIEAALEESPGAFLCGKEIGMVDILFGSMLYGTIIMLRGLKNYSLVLSGYSRIHAYREKISTIPRFDSIFPKEKIDYLFLSFLFEKFKDKAPADTKLTAEEVKRLEKEEALRAELALEQQARKEPKREAPLKKDSHSEASLRLMQAALGMTKAGSAKFKNRGEAPKQGKRRVKAKAVNVAEQDLLFCL